MSFLQFTAGGFYAITPSDTLEQTPTINAIYVGVSGDIKITGLDGSVETFTNVPVGILPVKARLVWATGTAATGLIGLKGK